MYHARSGKVDHPSHHRVGVPAAEEARRVPHPVNDDRVDKADDDEAVREVSNQLAALSDGAGHDGGASGAEAVLKEEHHPVVAVRVRRASVDDARQRKIAKVAADGPNERIGSAVSYSIADEILVGYNGRGAREDSEKVGMGPKVLEQHGMELGADCWLSVRLTKIAPPRHASRQLLRRMFFTFFARIEPAESSAKPACMRKTRHAAQSKNIVLSSEIFVANSASSAVTRAAIAASETLICLLTRQSRVEASCAHNGRGETWRKRTGAP